MLCEEQLFETTTVCTAVVFLVSQGIFCLKAQLVIQGWSNVWIHIDIGF